VLEAIARIRGEQARHKEQTRLFAWVISAITGEPLDRLMGEEEAKPTLSEEDIRQGLREEQRYLDQMKGQKND